jgi:hypothetical protein
MPSNWIIPVLTGSFALAGTLLGVLLNSTLTQRADRVRVRIEDDRRWLTDRRRIYVQFLTLAESLLDQIEDTELPSFDPKTKKLSRRDETEEGLDRSSARVTNELYPVLGELRLIASRAVADLAGRTSDALMLVWEDVAHGGGGGTHKPTRDLIDTTLNAMRSELGLPEAIRIWPTNSELEQWPWLPRTGSQ